jgi:hypothetical protein
MLLFPTRFSYTYNYLLTLPASRSSHAPVGLFYAFPLCESIGLKSTSVAAGKTGVCSFTALADGGQLSAFFSLCCPVYAKWAGLF